MATYKKRGKTKRTKGSDNIDIIEQNSSTAEVFNTLDESASKSEEWVIKNQKNIFLVLGLIVASIFAYLLYQNYVVEPNEKEAADELSFPRKHYTTASTATVAVDSILNLGLNGSDGKYGFLDIASKYSGTKAGNLASYYAGMSYLQMKDYKNAIANLENFNATDDGLGPLVKGTIGDAFSDINQPEDAFDYYKKAANLKDNAFTTPMFLFKAANVAMDLGKYKEALSMFTKIESKYPKSTEAKNIKVYINRAKYASK